MKITTVINTYNEENNIENCLRSIKDFSDEIIVVDMYSSDKTVKIAEKYNAKILYHEYTRFVEPARNFAISKPTSGWIFLIDADEELSETLSSKLKEIVKEDSCDYVEIPRKNIIFGKWIEHSRWWPDFLIRFFKKGKIKFSERIHVPPSIDGKGIKLEAIEENALVHHNFQTIFQFVERLNRYTDIQSSELIKNGYKFDWKDLLMKPANEFFSRYYSGEGYKDGLHGFCLALLQAFSEITLYLKIWEFQKFEDQKTEKLNSVVNKIFKDYNFWQFSKSPNLIKKVRLKIKELL